MNLSFNGVTKSFITVTKKKRPLWAPRKRNILSVPGMPGGHLQNTDIEPLLIPVDIWIEATGPADLREKAEEIASWLDTDEAVPLIFSDEPGRTYYAIVDGALDPDEIVAHSFVTVSFLCPDPYKYGQEKTAIFPSDNVTLTNEGTAEADPIFELEVLAPVTFAMIQNQDNEYMMIGQPIDVDSIAFEERETILNDSLGSTTGWTSGAQVENGVVSGTMVSDGSKFVVTDFGEPADTSKWYGPALKTSLSETLQDFRMDVRIANFNSANEVGRVIIDLLDVNGNVVSSIEMVDAWQGIDRNRARSYVKNETDKRYLQNINETTEESRGELWNDFDGILRLERVGNHWTSYFAQINSDGTHRARETDHFTDSGAQYQQEIAQVQIHIGIFGNYTNTDSYVSDLNVWKINNPDEFEIPYIAYPGDKIIFDHTQNGEVLINGEPYENINFGSSFFKLKNGENQLIVQPSDSFDIACRYRPRYK